MKTIEEVKNYIRTADEYKFLKDDERLGDRIILLTLGGSLSYGTERHDETGELLSDIDVRGITMPAIDEVFGLTLLKSLKIARLIRLFMNLENLSISSLLATPTLSKCLVV